MIESNVLKYIIKESKTKTDGKLDYTNVQNYLCEKLGPLNISIPNFYMELMNELYNLLSDINNLIQKQKTLFEKNEELDYFYKGFDIFFCITRNCVNIESSSIVNADKMKNFVNLLISIIYKIISVKGNNINEKNNSSIEKFCNYICDIFKIFSDINLDFIIENCLEEKNYFSHLLEEHFTRKIIYDCLKKIIHSKKKKDENFHNKIKLINNVIEHLMQKYSNNIDNIINDVKLIIKVFRNNIDIISYSYFNLLKLICDSYKTEMGNQYKDLFFFFFDQILFEENKNNKDEKNIICNKEFSVILFDIFEYLLNKNNKELYEIFLINLFTSINNNDLKEGKKQGKGKKKYQWLLTNTEYIKKVLNNFPKIYNENLFSFYLTSLMALSEDKNHKKKYLPEIDFIIFFKNIEKYLNNENYKKDYIISFFTKKITDFIKFNDQLIEVILVRCQIFKLIINLVDQEKEKDIKIKLLDFMEEILNENNDRFSYDINLDIRTDLNEINTRINLILIGYECDDSKFNDKMKKLIEFMNIYCREKKIDKFLQICDIIFQIIIDYKFKKINSISDDNLFSLNNILLQLSVLLANSQIKEITDCEKKLENYAQSYLNCIYRFIFQFNKKKFDYKAEKNIKKTIYFTKRIIQKKILKDIVKNLLMSQNHIVKKKTFEYLIKFSIDEKNNLILSSYILFIITNIYYEDKNYKCLQKLFRIILNLIIKFEINAKILLNYDFVSIAIDILCELYAKNGDSDEYYQTIFLFLKEICKYLTQELIMKYLNKLFIIFNKNVLSQISDLKAKEKDSISIGQKRNNVSPFDIYDCKKSNDSSIHDNENGRINIGYNLNSFEIDNEEGENELNNNIINDGETNNEREIINNNLINNKSKICLDLFNLLKSYLNIFYKNKDDFMNDNLSNYLIISNYLFPNHLINNLLFLDNINNCKEKKIIFRIQLKISSYNGINGFNLLQIRNEKVKILFKINENNTLEIKEKKEDYSKFLAYIENLDKTLPADDKFHDITIVFDDEEKNLNITIDNIIVLNKSSHYKIFKFEEAFKVIIGFNYSSINYDNDINLKMPKYKKDEITDDNMNKAKDNNSTCFIFISYLLILNKNEMINNQEINDFIREERNYSPNSNLLSYCYRKKNKNLGSDVITEIDFRNKDINLVYSNVLSKNKEIKEFITNSDNSFVNRYIPYIENNNSFKDNSRISFLYIISRNENISEYYSLNNICELEKMSKSIMCSKLFNDYDTIYNLCNNNIIDFLLGFLFLIQKRFNELKNKDDENDNDNNNNDEEVVNLYGNNLLINEEIVIEYILIIFEIIMLIPSKTIKNYFIGDESCSNLLKLKYFFYRNIDLLNYDETFFEKILKIFLSEHENKDNKIVLNQKLIFISIINEIFLDLNIFEKLEENNQNNIFSHIMELMEKSEYERNDNKGNKYLLNLITNLINIIKYSILSLVENNEGKTQIDYIINCVDLLLIKVLPTKDKDFENQLRPIFSEVFNFSYDKKHINEELCNKYNYIFNTSSESDDFSENKNIFADEQLDKINNQIKSFNSFINQNIYINDILKYNNNKTKCSFCDNIKSLFFIKKNFIYNGFIFDKLYKYFFRNYYLNFGYNSEIFKKQKYAWFLSLKESHEKLQNKLFLKEDHIKIFSVENPKSKKITHHFRYDYGQKNYIKTFKELNKLVFYDKISTHYNLIEQKNPEKKSKNVYNCLIVNKLHKIMSVIILNDDYISIYYNIFIDKENKINIVKSETTHSFWTKNKNDSSKELDAYIVKNEEEIKKEIYKLNSNNSNKKKVTNKFFYDRCYKFSKRKIHLKEINEMYKRQHLHIPNALEIFIKNGESYFIVLNPDNRDKLFEKIILNIDNIYENDMKIFKHSKIWTSNNKENCFYIKHCPIISLHQSQEAEYFIKNQKKMNNINNKDYKIVMDENSLKDVMCNNWTKNRISNYDYLMLLNILSGRSLNDLSQYFIFPWIIKDFDKNNLNWLSDEIYRDLSLPIHACGEDKERIISKYELLDDEKYHSGTFYSTHSFVSYFLIRQRPFTEIHLEMQGAKFDAQARMFNSAEQLSNISEKYQELIPSLFYFPELFIKESYLFESNEKEQEPFNDYILPNWCKNDPRKFTIILKKILESKKVSINLNSWIDLIFGYKQKGPNAIKSLNIYRNACYPSTKAELEKMEEDGELESYMYEKEELGCTGKQLFNKAHKSKDVNIENTKNKKIFFNDNAKLLKLKLKQIKHSSEKGLYKSKISFKKISDIIFGPNSAFNDNNNKKTYYQGGLSSLSSIMNCLNIDNIKSNDSINKIIKSINAEEDFILLNKNYKYLRKLNLIVTYDKNCIELINIGDNVSYFYYLKDINGDISCLTTNQKGTKLYIGFSNGNINFYKIIKLPFDKTVNEDDYISSFSLLNEKLSLENKNIYINIEKDDLFIYKNKYKIYLKKISENYFLNNNPHIPKKINLISMNEYHKTLITLDESNLIYIISLNNKGKLMHISHFLSNTKYKMKEIIPLSWNGDFIIYSSYTVHLFSINGIPLCELSLFDKVYENLNSIKCCNAALLHDVTIFTSHKDGSLFIWQVKNKDIEEKFDERVSFVYNKKKSKFFLPEYKYGYNNIYNGCNETKIDEYELQRKFENINQVNVSLKANNYFNFMKISSELDYMILFDTEKNMYILSNPEEGLSKSVISFGLNKKKHHERCYNCNNLIIGPGIRPTLVNFDSNQITQDINDDNNTNFNDNNNKKVICEECKQKLKSTEYFIYNN